MRWDWGRGYCASAPSRSGWPGLADPAPCPACTREHARLARHQAAVCRAQTDGPAARILEAFAGQLEAMADQAETRLEGQVTERRVTSIMCPACKTELLVP